ncbi:hypothetical protein Tcan_01084, partial [Toxocara canis]
FCVYQVVNFLLSFCTLRSERAALPTQACLRSHAFTSSSAYFFNQQPTVTDQEDLTSVCCVHLPVVRYSQYLYRYSIIYSPWLFIDMLGVVRPTSAIYRDNIAAIITRRESAFSYCPLMANDLHHVKIQLSALKGT